MTAPAKTEMSIDELIEQLGNDDITAAHVQGGLTYVIDQAKELDKKRNSEGLTRAEKREVLTLREQLDKLAEARDAIAAEDQAADEAFNAIPENLDAPEEGDESEDPDAEPDKTEDPAEPAAAPDAGQPAAVAASATGRGKIEVPTPEPGAITAASRRRGVTAATPRPAYAITAAAGSNKPTGVEMNRDELISAMEEARNDTAGTGNGEVVRVATIKASGSDENRLRKGQADENTRKMNTLAAPQAITAAGICAPYAVQYDLDVLGSTDRPLRDSGALVNTLVDRGGIQYRRDLDGAAAGPEGASGVWTHAMSAAVGTGSPPAAKAIWKVPCVGVVSDEVQAVTLGLQFDNIQTKFDPEATAANVQAAHVAHARFAENILLAGILNRSTTHFTTGVALGAVRDVLAAIDHAVAYYRYRHRLPDEVPLRMIAPQWLKIMFRTDLMRSMTTGPINEIISITDATIQSFFDNRNVNITWHLDGRGAQTAGSAGTGSAASVSQQYAAPANGALPKFPTQVEMALYSEGSWWYLDSGRLDVGVVRDKDLVQTNEHIQFEESWEGLAFKGVESLRLVSGVKPLGLSQGTTAIDFSSF